MIQTLFTVIPPNYTHDCERTTGGRSLVGRNGRGERLDHATRAANVGGVLFILLEQLMGRTSAGFAVALQPL